MKLKYICKICNKEISSHGLGMHIKWHNLTKKEYSAKLKNFYSRVNNAILDMEIDKGSFTYL